MITHPEKVLFPTDGITKGELAAYYEAIAPVILPHVRGRPITMERYPAGIGKPGFWQKNVSKGFPAWLQRVSVPKKGGMVHHPVVRDARSLLWLANQNTITTHVWPSRAPDLDRPDVCIFDLDPSADEPVVLRDAALRLRDLLAEIGLPSWVKTTGSKGFHIAVPLDGKADFGDVARFAHAVGRRLVERDPDHLTLEFHKADRGERILSIPAGTATAPPSPPPTPCAPGRGRQCRHPVRGSSSSAARWDRRPSPCGRWPAAWQASATCGPRCGGGGGRCTAPSSGCGAGSSASESRRHDTADMGMS